MNKMSYYRVKPVVIKATQWFKNGDHPNDYLKDKEGFVSGNLSIITADFQRENNWEGQVVRYFRRPDVSPEQLCRHCSKCMHDHGWIDTLEGGHIVCPGDYIITGLKGEYYPCKPDIFEMKYEIIGY